MSPERRESAGRTRLVRHADGGEPVTIRGEVEENVWTIGRRDRYCRCPEVVKSLKTGMDFPKGQIFQLPDGRVMEVVSPSRSAEASARNFDGGVTGQVFVRTVFIDEVNKLRREGVNIPKWNEVDHPPIQVDFGVKQKKL